MGDRGGEKVQFSTWATQVCFTDAETLVRFSAAPEWHSGNTLQNQQKQKTVF
jgi:hypothetical protein